MKKPVIIWGGADVNSEYYNEPRSKYAQRPDTRQDVQDFNVIRHAISNNIPVIGICRGAQALCVAHGGKLYQHSVPHKHNHSIATIDGKVFENVAAGHHQIMKPVGHFELVGWNPNETKVWNSDNDAVMLAGCAEIVWYPNTNCLAIQPHPEWITSRPNDFIGWLNKKIKKLDIDYAF